MAQVLEDLPEVSAYVKNQGLQFTIPYTINSEPKSYYADFLVRAAAAVTVIVEVSGEARKDKAAKTSTARTLWVPAVNNHGGFGRSAFVEVTDPWEIFELRGDVGPSHRRNLQQIERGERTAIFAFSAVSACSAASAFR
jgi:hypothetical protein